LYTIKSIYIYTYYTYQYVSYIYIQGCMYTMGYIGYYHPLLRASNLDMEKPNLDSCSGKGWNKHNNFWNQSRYEWTCGFVEVESYASGILNHAKLCSWIGKKSWVMTILGHWVPPVIEVMGSARSFRYIIIYTDIEWYIYIYICVWLVGTIIKRCCDIKPLVTKGLTHTSGIQWV